MSDYKKLIGKTVVCIEIGGYGLRLKFSDGSVLDYTSYSDGDSFWEIIDDTKQADGCEYWDSESNFCTLRRPADHIKYGKWVHNNPLTDTLVCTECDYNIPTEEFKTPYCPWCGAYMERSEE